MRTKFITLGLLSSTLVACGEVGFEEAGDAGPLEEHAIAVATDELTQRVVNDGSVSVFPGQGRDSISEEWRNRCVTAPILQNFGSAESHVVFNRSMTRDELHHSLGLSFSGRAQFGLFGGSARASFTRETQSVQHSINMVYSSRSLLNSDVLDTTRLTWQVAKTNPAFRTQCGDTFVHELKKGGEIYIMVRLDFASMADKTAFETAFSGSFAMVDAATKLRQAKQSFSGRATVHLEAYQRGGETERLAHAVGGANALAAITCSLDNLAACETFMANALSYATGFNSWDFPQNLRRRPADNEFVLRDWASLGAGAAVQQVPVAIQWIRAALAFKLHQQVEVRNRYKALVTAGFYGAPPLWQLQAAGFDAQAAKNVTVLNAIAVKCYDDLGNPPTQAQLDACGAAMAGMDAAGYKDLADWAVKMDTPLGRSTLKHRTDFVKEVTPGVGHWGGWTDWALCPSGTHMVGYRQRVQGSCGSGCDDTGLNSIEMVCADWSRTQVHRNITPHGGWWGTWHPEATCTRGPINGMRIQIEAPQGEDGDDTAANAVYGSCVSGEQITAPGGTPWGSTGAHAHCPAGTAVCGFKLRYEEPTRPIDVQDDTAMNGLSLACCAY